MRVLYLNPFSQEVSGPDESLRTLLRALIPLGVDAHVVLPRPGPQVQRYEGVGAAVHYAPLTVLNRRLGARALLLPFQLAWGSAAVARIVRRERIDMIHTNMEVVLDGSVASRLLGTPHVLHYRGNTNDEPKAVFDVLTRWWTVTADRVFCISEKTAGIFRRRGLGGRVETLYNPVDIEAFATAERSEAVRRELGAAPGDLLIGTVGRIHPRKDVATFLRAGAVLAERMRDARLAIIGSAETALEQEYASQMRELASRIGIADRVTWAGSRRDIPRVLKALDVFVMASRNEGFGRVVAEALAAGTPQVVSDEGALPELVSGASIARLAPPGEPLGFASAVLDLLATPRGARVDELTARFSTRVIAARVLQTYTALLTEHRSPVRNRD